jgi:hypothetical protein
MIFLYRLTLFVLNKSGFAKLIPDDQFLKLLYRRLLKRNLNLKNPVTLSEKLNWLKLFDRKPEYTKMVDKYQVKKYVADIIGDKYIIPTLGVWDKFDDIDFDKLPNQFVLKCTHDSGGIIICKDKSKFDYKKARTKINTSLKKNYYFAGREWPYKNVIPKIIAEEFMVEEKNADLKDYKIFNFNGKPKLIQVDFDRFTNHKRNFYSIDWDFIEMELFYRNSPQKIINKPLQLHEMLKLSEKLAEKIPFSRIDFYSIQDKIYFGEITFFPEGGFFRICPKELDFELTNLLNLPEIDQN